MSPLPVRVGGLRVAWQHGIFIYMNRYCANPECADEFSPTETANDFCSWECEERVNALEDLEV